MDWGMPLYWRGGGGGGDSIQLLTHRDGGSLCFWLKLLLLLKPKGISSCIATSGPRDYYNCINLFLYWSRDWSKHIYVHVNTILEVVTNINIQHNIHGSSGLITLLNLKRIWLKARMKDEERPPSSWAIFILLKKRPNRDLLHWL